MRKKRYVLVAWIFCFFLFLSPGAQAQDYNEIFITPGDSGAMHEISQYDVLAIRLRCNPSAGYTWEAKDLPEFLQLVGEEEFIPDSELIGSPGELVLRFAGKNTGQGNLQLVHHRPWDKEHTLINECTVHVKSQGAFQGTIPNHHGSLAAPKALFFSRKLSSTAGTLGLPISFNWCDHGGCSSVKNQGQCGSCWAFATVGPLESSILIKDGIERDLSEQYLLSCNDEDGTCAGAYGWAHHYHMDYYIPEETAAGAVDETDFPYSASDEACNGPHDHHETITNYQFVGTQGTIPSPEAIKEAIYTYGPITVAVYAGSDMDSYSDGIFVKDIPNVRNHGVVLTGWDESGDTSYWYMKNSWGPNWGEAGYMRIKYGVSSIGEDATYIEYPGDPIGPFARIYYTTYTDNLNVDFVDGSTCGECTLVNWEWDFGDGSSANEPSPSHTYAAEGTYTVSLTITTNDMETFTVPVSIPVPRPLEYCVSQAQGIGTAICEFILGDFSHSSGETVYSDFNTEVIDVDAGTPYGLSITLDAGKWYQNWFCIWIDLNRDGDFFDEGEKVYQSADAHCLAETGTLVIPDIGSVTTRMRVSVKRKVLASPDPPKPCEEFYRGEVEDYTVCIHADLVSCDSDFDLDFDVDGSNLAQYADSITGPTLPVFAGEFGSPDCR